MPNYLIHKPYGYISQFISNETKRKNKKLLGELFDFPKGIMAIGRLDEDSEGLLLLTTNGKLSEKIRSKAIEKEYYAQVDGIITNEAIEKIQNGLEIGILGKRFFTDKCKASIISEPNFPKRIVPIRMHRPTSWVSITLTEGKLRQVRKMTAAVGFPTLRLVRVRIGGLIINDLKPGKVELIENSFESILGK